MAKQKSTGLLVNGSVKAAGERRSRGQFDQRMRMRHTIALWHIFRVSEPLFGEGVSAYRRFASAANRLTPVYVPCNGPLESATFLLPGIPVSAGQTVSIKEWFGKVDGEDVLLTNLRPADLDRHEELRLCCLRQSLGVRSPAHYHLGALNGLVLLNCDPVSKTLQRMTGSSLHREYGAA